jgi:hypothetical protein
MGRAEFRRVSLSFGNTLGFAEGGMYFGKGIKRDLYFLLSLK